MNVPEAPFVLHLPNVMHLATDLAGVVHDAATVSSLQLASRPAPLRRGRRDPERTGARDLIAEVEGMDRGRYAGPGRLDRRPRRRRVGHRAALGRAARRHGAAVRRLRDRRRLRPRGRARRVAGEVRPRARRPRRRLTRHRRRPWQGGALRYPVARRRGDWPSSRRPVRGRRRRQPDVLLVVTEQQTEVAVDDRRARPRSRPCRGSRRCGAPRPRGRSRRPRTPSATGRTPARTARRPARPAR